MIDPADIPPIDASELLARFLVQSKHFRPSDRSVKPDAFFPPPNLQLSVTRHRLATEDEVWSCGKDVANECRKELYGRADITAMTCQNSNLRVVQDATPLNPNHAYVEGWPADKSAQKSVAQELAANATCKLIG